MIITQRFTILLSAVLLFALAGIPLAQAGTNCESVAAGAKNACERFAAASRALEDAEGKAPKRQWRGCEQYKVAYICDPALASDDCSQYRAEGCVRYREAKAEMIDAKARFEAAQSAAASVPAASDTNPPRIALDDHGPLIAKNGRVTVSGYLGDETSKPVLIVDGTPRAVLAAGAGAPDLGAETRRFKVIVPLADAAQEAIVLEACDRAGNCVAEQVAVGVATE